MMNFPINRLLLVVLLIFFGFSIAKAGVKVSAYSHEYKDMPVYIKDGWSFIYAKLNKDKKIFKDGKAHLKINLVSIGEIRILKKELKLYGKNKKHSDYNGKEILLKQGIYKLKFHFDSIKDNSV